MTHNITVRISTRNARGYRVQGTEQSPYVWVTVPVEAATFREACKIATKIAKAQVAA